MTLYVCDSCGNVVADEYCSACDSEDAYEYDGEVYSQDDDEDDGEEVYECTECGDEFDSAKGLKVHQRVHD